MKFFLNQTLSVLQCCVSDEPLQVHNFVSLTVYLINCRMQQFSRDSTVPTFSTIVLIGVFAHKLKVSQEFSTFLVSILLGLVEYVFQADRPLDHLSVVWSLLVSNTIVEGSVIVLIKQSLHDLLEDFVERLINVLLSASCAPSVSRRILVGKIVTTHSNILETTYSAWLFFQFQLLLWPTRRSGNNFYLAVLFRLFLFAIHHGITDRMILVFIR